MLDQAILVCLLVFDAYQAGFITQNYAGFGKNKADNDFFPKRGANIVKGGDDFSKISSKADI